MNGRTCRWLARLTAILLFCHGSAVLAQAVGQVTSVVGDVEVVRNTTGNTEPLAFKDSVYLRDLVRTAENSHTKLLLLDSSILKIGPLSELLISEQLVGVEGGDRTVIKLIKGFLRSLIGKKLQRTTGHFEIHTPVAVALVRGTDFEVWSRSPGETVVRTFEGSVEVYNLDPAVRGKVIVGPNSYTVVGEGLPPTSPRDIPSRQPLQQQFGEQLDSIPEATDEMKLRHAEVGQIRDPDTSESSPEGQAIQADIELDSRVEQLTTESGADFISDLVDEVIYPDTIDVQTQTVTQPDIPPPVDVPAPGGAPVPIQIGIPTP